ncbi:hypothetical protein C1645_822431 [Glomus cerebriforme]|uniref:Uncharacterized protein n=1 Tax=Glomus cerebriforme TaxID=658196 RepID=A0A397T4A1_9GLOM|nr:hypothetical protein C1645_822431 [Glomus cerebriforme]
MSPISLTELKKTLSSLPNNKAGVPSGIKYEDLTHLDEYTEKISIMDQSARPFEGIQQGRHIIAKNRNVTTTNPIKIYQYHHQTLSRSEKQNYPSSTPKLTIRRSPRHRSRRARQLINNLQLDLWLPWWPSLQDLLNIDQTKYLPFTSFTKGLIRFAHMGFTFTPNFNTVIRDQLINIDGIYIKEWHKINVNPFDRSEKLPGRQPHWYQRYIDTKTTGYNKNLTIPINVNCCHLPSHKLPKISSLYHYRPKNEWTSYWHAPTSQVIFGKSIEQHNDLFSPSLTYIEH